MTGVGIDLLKAFLNLIPINDEAIEEEDISEIDSLKEVSDLIENEFVVDTSYNV